MTSSFLFTSESVTEGHPDKICDNISDAFLDEYLRQDPNSRVAVETMVTTDFVAVSGEVTSKADFDQKAQEELEPIEKGVCVAGEARKDREESPKEKIKELEEALANALAVNESHQKLNGKLQQRVTELEEDNKKLAHEIEDRVHKMRKSGL